MKIKPTKCEFLKTKCHFLGRVIENGTIQPDREHVAKVLDWDQPRTVRQMQSFIGFCNYYREFVPRFSEVIEPLRRTMNIRSKKLTWSEDATVGFAEVKRLLTSAPILSLPQDEGKFVLDTDASNCAISGILHQYQKNEKGEEVLRPISYGSKALAGAELRYPARRPNLWQ